MGYACVCVWGGGAGVEWGGDGTEKSAAVGQQRTILTQVFHEIK